MSQVSLVHLGEYSISLSLSCSIRALWGTVGTIFALFEAEISKNLFEPYHHIDSLAETFPQRVKIIDNVVQISGPVLISSGSIACMIPIAISAMISIPCAMIAHEVVSMVWTRLNCKKPEEKLPKNAAIIVSLIGSAAFIGPCIFLFDRIPVEDPGIHLLNWSFRKIN
jgi:hypothetical protein